MGDSNYHIVVEGKMKNELLHEFGDLHPVVVGTRTTLTLDTDDQASLHGVLARARDFGLVIESVRHGERSATQP